MSKNIADLYNEVMSSQAATEKTASATQPEGAVFDRGFFEKVASGDEESVGALNAFIDEARGEGYNDEQIETAIGEAMNEAGVDGAEVAGAEQASDDGFEMAKSAAYAEGCEEAFAHVMDSEIVKTAGLTEQDLMEYELGLAKGQGYAETRAALESVVEKIAAGKVEALKAGLGKAKNTLVAGAKRYGQLMAGGAKGTEGTMEGVRAGNKKLLHNLFGKGGMHGEAAKSLAARAGTAAAAGGVGYAATRKSK